MKLSLVSILVFCAFTVSVIQVDAKPVKYLDLIIEDDVAKEEIETRRFFWNNKPDKENRKKVVILLVEDDEYADDTEGSYEVIPKPQNKRKTILKRKRVERPTHTHYHDSGEEENESNEYEHKYSNKNKHNLYGNDDESGEVDYDEIYRPYSGRYPQSPTQGIAGPSTPWWSNSWETQAWTTGDDTPDSGEDQDQDYEGDTYEYNGEESEDMDIPSGSEEEASYSRIESDSSPLNDTDDEADKSSEKPEQQGGETGNSGVESGDVEGDSDIPEQIDTKEPENVLISQEVTENITQDQDYEGDTYEYNGEEDEDMGIPTGSEEEAVYSRIESGSPFDATEDEADKSSEMLTKPEQQGGETGNPGEESGDVEGNTQEQIATEEPETVLISQEKAEYVTQGALSVENLELPVSTDSQSENTEEIVTEYIQNVTTDTQKQNATKEPEDVQISKDETENITQGTFSEEDLKIPVSTTTQPESTVEIVTEAVRVLVETTEILRKETKNGADQGSTSQNNADNATNVQGSNNHENSVTYIEKITDKETGVTVLAAERDSEQEANTQEGSTTGEEELVKHYYYRVPRPILITYFQRRPTGEDGQNGPNQDPDEPRSGFRLGSLQHKAKRVIKKIVKNKNKIINRKTHDLLG